MKTLLSLFVIFFALAILVAFSGACTSQKKDGEKTGDPILKETGMTVDYEGAVKPIIKARCDKCHSGRSEKYSSLKNDDYTKKVKNYIVTNRMPKDGPLSAGDKKIVLSWLDSLSGM